MPRMEWNVLIVYNDGSSEHFIFEQLDAPTIPDVVRLVENELMDKGSVHRLVINEQVREV